MQHIGLIGGLLNDVFQRHSLLRGDQGEDGQPTETEEGTSPDGLHPVAAADDVR